jgi:pimeloyl-ACP methyl ester carboxylesterase
MVAVLPEAPQWFVNAVARRPDEAVVEVAGCPIHYLRWGEPGGAGVVLLHGGAAHAHWWSFLAPYLADRRCVVAVDLSGHGDSGRRPEYTGEVWAGEAMAAAEHAGIAEPPVLIGHSMGGFVSISAAATSGDRLTGAVIVDSPVRKPDPETEEGRGGRAFRNPKTYPDLDTAVGHFHLIPPQPDPEPWIKDWVARHSLRETPEGWAWKFDPGIFARQAPRPLHEYLASTRCRMAIMRGEFSDLVTPEVADYMSELLGRNAPFVEIPQAHHHLILDQPLAFVAAVRALLADWEHSTPAAEAWVRPRTG